MCFFADDSPILSEKEIKTEKIDEDQEKEDDSLEDPDDDPIVKEIPVFLSKGLSKNLHLFQVSQKISKQGLIFFANFRGQFETPANRCIDIYFSWEFPASTYIPFLNSGCFMADYFFEICFCAYSTF